jgi:hypothetical protein
VTALESVCWPSKAGFVVMGRGSSRPSAGTTKRSLFVLIASTSSSFTATKQISSLFGAQAMSDDSPRSYRVYPGATHDDHGEGKTP